MIGTEEKLSILNERLRTVERDVSILKGIEREREPVNENGWHCVFDTPWGALSVRELIEKCCKADKELALSERMRANQAETIRKATAEADAETARGDEWKRKYDALVASAQKLHIVVQGDEFRIEPRKDQERCEALKDAMTPRLGKGIDISCGGIKR